MQTLPEWWLFLSGTFYAVMIIVFLLIAFILVKLILQSSTILKDIHKIIEKMDRIVDKLEFSLHDVSEIAKNINRLSSTVTEKVIDTSNRVSNSAQKASMALLAFTTLKKAMGVMNFFKRK